MTPHVQVALARKTLGAGGLWVFGSAASAPMVVLVGGIVATYASTGVQSLPLVFVLVGAVVALLAVGYAAMSRVVPHAAAYYAILTRGLGRRSGVAGGFIAALGYNAIQISLYGLLGATLSGLIGGLWWVWAALAIVLVGVLGVRAIVLSTRLLAVILAVSVIVVVLFTTASLVAPQTGSFSWQGFSPSGLFVSGIGGAVALSLAALMGVDAPASFAEETRDEQAVSKGVFGGVLFLTVLYAVAAFAMGVAVGPDNVAKVAADPNSGLPLNVLDSGFGAFMVPIAQTVLIFAIITSLLAFHSVVARYTFGMAREGVLPAALARAGSGARVNAPVGGSILQSVAAAVTVAVFALLGADPVATVFTWLSTLGALSLLCLLLAASLAALTFFSRNRQAAPNVWTGRIAPLLGLIFGSVVLLTMVVNVGSLLGAAPGSVTPYLLPLIVAITAVTGAIWAGRLRAARPEVYAGISQGRPDTHAVPDDVNVDF